MLDDSRYNVPYFCPKCGRDKTNFDSLVALRHHVDVFHFKQQRDPLPKNGYHQLPPMEWVNGGQDLVDKHLRPPPDFPAVNDYTRRNQTPLMSQESRLPGPPANASSRTTDRGGVPHEVNQTLRHLEELRRSSDKTMSSQREQLKRLEEEVRAKESHLEKTKTEVDRAVKEKRNLEKECLEMRKDKMEDQEKLDSIRKKIEEQNDVIDKKEKELKKLRDFIRNAAQKETDAKKKLEETVEKILLRAEKAEKELEEMRERNNRLNQQQQPTIAPTSDASASLQSNDPRNNRADDVRDVISGTNLAYAAAATHSSNILSGVESLPPDQRNRAAAEAIDDIEQQDLSPMAQEYIRNFLAYYRALRRSEHPDNSPNHNAITNLQPPPRNELRPMAAGPSNHVTGLSENPPTPERDRRVFDDPVLRSLYPTFESSPYGYDDPGRDPSRQRPDVRRYNQQHPGGRPPSRDDWVMRSEAAPQLSSTIPLRDGCWTPTGGYGDPYGTTPIGRSKDDLEIDGRGIVWDQQPPKQYLGVDERPVKGSRMKRRRPKTDPGYVAGHHAKNRDFVVGHPSSAVYPGIISPSVTRAPPQTTRRKEGEGRMDEDYSDHGSGQRRQERFRSGESLERGPDVSDTLTEVTRDSDYDAGSLVLPERDWSVEGKPRQLGEGSTGDSDDGKPTEEEHDEEEEEALTPDDSMPSREVTDSSSDVKTPTPVPLPRSSAVHKSEPALAEEKEEEEEEEAKSPVIPVEVLALVLPHLDTLSLCQAALVSKAWLEVSRNPDVWQTVTIKNAQISSRFLKIQSKWCTKLKRIYLEGIRGRSKTPSESDDVYAKKTRGCLEAGFDALLSASQDSLIAVSVVDCSNVLTERCLWQVSCYCRLPQDMTYVSDLDPAGPEVMWALGAGCRDVKYVKIPPRFPSQKPERFNNKCVQVIGRCWPLLLSLSLGGVEVDIKGLAIIAQCCLKLESLELDHMCEVTEEMAVSLCQHGLKGLQRLTLTHTPATPKAILHFHSACPHLKSITVQMEIMDYFGDPDNEKNIREYDEILEKLTKLKSVPGMENVFHLETE